MTFETELCQAIGALGTPRSELGSAGQRRLTILRRPPPLPGQLRPAAPAPPGRLPRRPSRRGRAGRPTF